MSKPAIGTLQKLLSKYRVVLVPLVIALVLDVGLLAVNSVLALQLEQSATLINLAGRQRMLSQKITKSAALIYYQKSTRATIESSHQEFNRAVALFDNTLKAFARSGLTSDAEGHRIYVDAIELDSSRATLDHAMTLWQKLHSDIVHVQKVRFQTNALEDLLQQLTQKNTVLLQLMNDLTVQLEKEAAQQTRILRYFQTFIVVVILSLFGLAALRLKRMEEYFSMLMESASDIVLSIDVRSRNITFISKAVEATLGKQDQYYLRRPMDRLFTRKACRYLDEVIMTLQRGEPVGESRFELEVVKNNGEVLVVDTLMKASYDDHGEPLELLIDIRDITERKHYEQQLKTLAHSDSLTGLTNRSLFFDFARQAIARAARQEGSLAILFIDLDGFKAVNDNYGHDVGDRLLKVLAKNLKQCFRESDIVARVGGDEFAVLIDQIHEEEILKALCTKVVEQLSQAMDVESVTCQVSASIGVAIYPRDGTEVEALLARADEAMYRVKGNGGSNFVFSG